MTKFLVTYVHEVEITYEAVIEADCANYYVGNYGDDENDWCVVRCEDGKEEEYFKKVNRIVSEFISSIDIYVERFVAFSEEN